MSSGGSKTQTVTQKNEPPSWAVPYLKDTLDRANDLSTTPYTPYTGQLVAGQNGDQYASQDMIRQMAYGPSVIGNGQDYAAGLLGGGGAYQGNTSVGSGGRTNVGANRFLGEDNPYLDKMIASSSRDVTDNFSNATMPSVLAQFQQGGAFGGTAMQNQMASEQNTLAQSLGDLSNQYRFQDYQTQQAMEEAGLDRSVQAQLADAARRQAGEIASAQMGLQAWGQNQNAQLSALGMLPDLNQAQYLGASMLGTQGDQKRALQQSWLDSNYGQYLDARGWEMGQFNPLLQGLAAVQGGSVTSTQPYQGPSASAGALGGAASGAAMGSAFGPWGTAIGAVGGGLMGYFGSR